MIVILKNGAAEEKKNQLIDWLKEQGLQIHTSVGEYQTVLGLVGDTSRVDMDLIASLGIVDSVKRVTEPFKCCNRKFHPDDTVVQVGDVRIGGGNFVMIAGPCSVESEEQIVGIAKAVKASGAQILRGGAFNDLHDLVRRDDILFFVVGLRGDKDEAFAGVGDRYLPAVGRQFSVGDELHADRVIESFVEVPGHEYHIVRIPDRCEFSLIRKRRGKRLCA